MIKKGITITTLAISIIIISILATVITSSIYSTISFSKLSTWANELRYIEDTVKEEVMKSSATNILKEDISIDVSSLSQEQISEQFEGELITDSLVDLKVIDLGLLKITDTVYGNQNTPNDVYAYSEITGRVYYVEGIEISGKTYYTVANNLLDMFGIEKDESSLSTIVFEPSIIGYTNEPITVKVKVPNTFTNVSITTTNNSIVVGNSTTNGNNNEYIVNTTNIAGNYTVTVTYTSDGNIKTSTYEVNGYDNTAPTITISKAVGTINISATDNSRVKKIKFIEGIIASNEIENFFESNGKTVVNNKIKINYSVTDYTIYSEDLAGNYSYTVVPTIEDGDYVEYDVTYTDVLQPANVYSSLNGWRVVKATKNNDGSYSNIIIMSTGVPAYLRYNYSDSTNNTWWITDDDKLTEFKSTLTSLGDNNYTFYTGTNYYSLQASAGLFFNFESIRFKYSEEARGRNEGFFNSITINEIEYSSNSNSNVEKSGGELFNLLEDKAKVRILTLPELNISVKRNDIDTTNSITNNEDPKGLYVLAYLTEIPNMKKFVEYSESNYYWLASPLSSSDDTQNIIYVGIQHR